MIFINVINKPQPIGKIMEMDKEKVLITLRPEFNEKLTRVSKKEGVPKGVYVESMLKKVKEPKDE